MPDIIETEPLATPAPSPQATATLAKMTLRPRTGGNRTLRWFFQNVVWIWLIGLVLLFGIFNQYFLTLSNFRNILVQSTVLGLLALAVSLPLFVAEIDLSIAANMGFSSVIGALALNNLHAPTAVGILIGIAAATLVGFLNGLFIAKLRMVSLIETLAMQIILQGALLAISQGNTVTNLSDDYIWIGQHTVENWPVMPLVLLVVMVMMSVMLRRTVFGRSLYATGGNAPAAVAAGIRVQLIKIMAFTLAGTLCGLAGYLLAAWQIAITANQGEGFLMYAIAAPIIGGVSVFGGRGNTLGILGGVLLLTVIRVGLEITAVPSFYVGMIGGILIFVAVAVDALRVNFFSR